MNTLPSLYVIADYDYVGDPSRWHTLLQQLNQCSGIVIQVRAHQLRADDTQGFATIAQQARQWLADQPHLFLNGDPELAQELNYAGCHLPQYMTERSLSARPALLSAATHDIASAQQAADVGADALLFSPVYRPNSKAGTAAGLPALASLCAAISKPVYAMGGILPERVAPCRAAGAYGVAVLGDIADAQDPLARISTYQELLADEY